MEGELGEVVLGGDDTDTQETWLKNLSNSLPVCELYDISFSALSKNVSLLMLPAIWLGGLFSEEADIPALPCCQKGRKIFHQKTW